MVTTYTHYCLYTPLYHFVISIQLRTSAPNSGPPFPTPELQDFSSSCWLLRAHSTSGSNTTSNTTSSPTPVYSGSDPNLVPSRLELVMLHTSGSGLLYWNPIAPPPPELRSCLRLRTLTSSSVLSPCILYCISFIISSQYSRL